MLDPQEASELLTDVQNRNVVMPYLNGADLNDDPRQLPSRWVINFFDWPLQRAEAYQRCMEIVRERVKPDRDQVNRKAHREQWWLYGDKRPGLYSAIRGMNRVIAIANVSKTVVPAFVEPGYVYSHMVVVFAYESEADLGVLTSAMHWWWAHAWCSTMRSAGLRYSPSDAFDTFPRPHKRGGLEWEAIGRSARALSEFRADLMERTSVGLTRTYNRVHDPQEDDPDIVRLRHLHVELDHAVRDAYGWADLDLAHHHWHTPQGMRFTVSPSAKDDLLDRLLELNHARFADEVAAGLHEKEAKKAPAKRARATDQDQGLLL